MAHTSIVKLLRDVPLNPSYSDTLLFSNVSEQTNYFNSKSVYTFNDIMYIRDGILLIPNQAGIYRTCSYLMYTNPDFPNKWFYAFISNVEYVADGTTKITYAEDVIQTWWFEMNIKPCFVKREHVLDDSIGANIKEENVSLGDYVYNDLTERMFTNWVVIVASAISMSNPDVPASADILQGTISGLNWVPYHMTEDGITALRSDLDAIAQAGKSDAIVSIWAVPSFLIGSFQDGLSLSDALINNSEITTSLSRPTTIDGYLPKNNKLFIYPYCCGNVGTFTGQNVILRYEFFEGTPSLAYRGSPMPNGRIILYPKNYAGVTSNLDFAVNIGDFPQGSWTQDVYSNWLATQSVKWGVAEEERRINTLFDVTGEAASGLLSLSTGNLESGVQKLGEMIGSYLGHEKTELQVERSIAGEKEVMSIIPPSVKGTLGGDATLNTFSKYGFKVTAKTITAGYAKSIDDFFSLFGYRVDEVKQPNLTGRQSWNYVETVGAYVTGNAPLYAKEMLKSLLNSGIRFWHNKDVGNFSLPNGIIGG